MAEKEELDCLEAMDSIDRWLDAYYRKVLYDYALEIDKQIIQEVTHA